VCHRPPYDDLDITGFEQFMVRLRSAFPDSQYVIDEIIGEEDTTVTRLTFQGTHSGQLSKSGPTGRHVKVHGVNVYHWVGDRIVEEWLLWDELGFWQQLGFKLVPPEA
jgi:predicted ester cyclase